MNIPREEMRGFRLPDHEQPDHPWPEQEREKPRKSFEGHDAQSTSVIPRVPESGEGADTDSAPAEPNRPATLGLGSTRWIYRVKTIPRVGAITVRKPRRTHSRTHMERGLTVSDSSQPAATDTTGTPKPTFDRERAEAAVRELLFAVGENPDREGLKDTPARVARAYEEIFAGLYTDPTEVLDKTFNEDHRELVLVRDIPFYSTCEHHLVPFSGTLTSAISRAPRAKSPAYPNSRASSMGLLSAPKCKNG